MFGLGDDTIIAMFAMFAIFGPLFYFIYMVGKLIKYRIDKKYSSSNSGELQEVREFRQRTERRLRVLEELVAEQDDDIVPREKASSADTQNPNKQEYAHHPDSPPKDAGPSKAADARQEETPGKDEKSRLKNQLKS